MLQTCKLLSKLPCNDTNYTKEKKIQKEKKKERKYNMQIPKSVQLIYDYALVSDKCIISWWQL